MKSPFTSQSWEPRFVVEHYHRHAVLPGVQLWLMCAEPEFQGAKTGIRHISRRRDILFAAHPASAPRPKAEWEELQQPLQPEALAKVIVAWLGTAEYPAQPWFDGDEAKGFSMFWGYYGHEGGPPDGRGALIVVPKWFEIHK